MNTLTFTYSNGTGKELKFSISNPLQSLEFSHTLVRRPISFREKNQYTKWVEKGKPEHSTWFVFKFASRPRAINTHPVQEAGSKPGGDRARRTCMPWLSD